MNIPLIVPHSTPTPAQPPPPPPPPGGLPRFTADSIPSMAPFPQGGSAVEDSNAVQPKLQMSAWSEEVSGAGGGTFIHWPFQDPKLEVPTVYKAYVRLYPKNMALSGTVPPIQDPGIPIDSSSILNMTHIRLIRSH